MSKKRAIPGREERRIRAGERRESRGAILSRDGVESEDKCPTTSVKAAANPTILVDTNVLLAQCANWSAEQKRLAVYWLLRDLLGVRPEQESDVCDPEGFLYLHLVPPGLRAHFRMLEHPELEEQLQKISCEPTFSLQQIREEIAREIESEVNRETAPDFPLKN